ncbi:hypothetical protein SADUNF_Sadunf02G0029600 [Salix dunnii]|uniref:Uncharacterized protein n=1 Tax=Salix dunnii TaxID=1413687 RepID=A0A835TFA7_9ROSI|nr:hypothetical protein SADUNF_Sadunf02G0029600 [Salix dunnii]
MPLLTLLSFTSCKNLRKLLSYKCFTEMPVSLSDVSSSSFGADLELVVIENPALAGSLDGITAKLKILRFLDLSQNYFDGYVPLNGGNLTRLLKLDLSHGGFSGKIPEFDQFTELGVFGPEFRQLPTCHLGLECNKLEGTVHEMLGFLERGYEINVEDKIKIQAISLR